MESKIPYALKLHDKDARKEITEKYKSAKDQLNNMLVNFDQSSATLQEHLQGANSLNPDKSQMIAQGVVDNLRGLSQNMAMIHTPLYGENEPSFEGMANFLDSFDTLKDPNSTIRAMGEGNATPLQISVLRSSYPSIYNDYKRGLLQEVATNDLSDEAKSLVYGTTGIETDPKYSKSSLTSEIMAQQQAAQAQAQAKPPKAPSGGQSDVPSKLQVPMPSYDLTVDGP